jgi:hypothetical protein
MPDTMDEGRKRVLLIAASILAARKLAQFEGGARVPATICAISASIRRAEEIMAELIGGGRHRSTIEGTNNETPGAHYGCCCRRELLR